MSHVGDDVIGSRAVLALGANLGDPVDALDSAVTLLASDDAVEVVAVSSFYSTAPIGGPEQPDYVNAVVLVRTSRSPRELLALAHEVEAAHDRVRAERWGPRTLDVDVIAYDQLVSEDPELTLPHPRAHERAFVLVPWLEVEPDAALPGRGPVAGLLAGVADQRVERIERLAGDSRPDRGSR